MAYFARPMLPVAAAAWRPRWGTFERRWVKEGEEKRNKTDIQL
jgi:hypothetical protein